VVAVFFSFSISIVVCTELCVRRGGYLILYITSDDIAARAVQVQDVFSTEQCSFCECVCVCFPVKKSVNFVTKTNLADKHEGCRTITTRNIPGPSLFRPHLHKIQFENCVHPYFAVFNSSMIIHLHVYARLYFVRGACYTSIRAFFMMRNSSNCV